MIHASADAYAKATGKPAALTGHATVRLTNGRATERRIDLRTDDALIANALPRELTHVVLADMFADKPPPRWALEGMAILAGSPDEIDRYTRTLTRCAREGELRPLAAILELKDFPADKYTFRLKPEMRSFGEVIVHVTSGVVYAAKAVRGEKVKWDELNAKDYPNKGAAVALMERSINEANATLNSLAAANFSKTIEPWLSVLEHSAEHYGLLVAYYRANGIVPPESRPAAGK